MTSVENVYNLIPREEVQPEKPELYQSTNRAAVKAEYERSKASGKLFGPPGNRKPDPKQFTKKGDGLAKRPAAKVALSTQPLTQTVLAPGMEPRPAPSKYVPRHNETARLAPRTKKNFVKDNYTTAIKGPGRKSSHDKATFKGTGKVPAYITKRKSELKQEQEMQATLRAEADNDTGLTLMPEDERQSLLQGLKANHTSLQKAYLGLSVIVDTIPKKDKKQQMERQLADLEKDIAMLERNNTVYVRS